MESLVSGRRSCQDILKPEIDGVGPAEADNVACVASGDFDIGGAIGDVVFLANRSIVQEVVEDGLGEIPCDAGRVLLITITVEAGDAQPVRWRPAEGKI